MENKKRSAIINDKICHCTGTCEFRHEGAHFRLHKKSEDKRTFKKEGIRFGSMYWFKNKTYMDTIDKRMASLQYVFVHDF